MDSTVETQKALALLVVAICPECDGSGAVKTQTASRQYVTREMAIDAGDRAMEGTLYNDDEFEVHQCRWCAERALLLLSGLTTAVMVGCPKYNVYEQRLQGQAMLAHAQSSKEVAVAEARAKMESASLLADAEVARARGVAKANEIIGRSLKNNEAYLRYLWINGLESNNPTVIYVPTEANLPILEAARLKTEPK